MLQPPTTPAKEVYKKEPPYTRARQEHLEPRREMGRPKGKHNAQTRSTSIHETKTSEEQSGIVSTDEVRNIIEEEVSRIFKQKYETMQERLVSLLEKQIPKVNSVISRCEEIERELEML